MRNLPNIYTSYQPGTPVCNGVPGTFLNMLRTCLVTGTTQASFTNIVVSNGIATITSQTENVVYFNGSRITIEGCAEPQLNVTTEVWEHTVSTFSFKTNVADGTYGGAIKINQPGAGWSILYSGTNEAVFVSGNLDSLGVCIKIIDTNAQFAVIEFYENMTSLTVGVNKADPTMYEATRVLRIPKSGNATTNANPWWLIADNTNVHFTIERHDSSTSSPPLDFFFGGIVISWGQYKSLNDSDKRNFFFLAPRVLTTTSNGYFDSTWGAHIGYYYNSTPSDVNCSGFLATENTIKTKGWLKVVCATYPGFYNNASAQSGGQGTYRLGYKMPYNLLLTDYNLMSYGPARGIVDPVIQGTIVETKFSCQSYFGAVKSFSVTTFNGKRYIQLPIYVFNGLRPNASPSQSYCGIAPFLIGEKWE